MADEQDAPLPTFDTVGGDADAKELSLINARTGTQSPFPTFILHLFYYPF